jgi:tRNA/tmRNA/rRNA uracil-C5-methylase (TrmA/RlmC/RlmD family)
LELIYWSEIISEELHWLRFNISPKSFFQTNSSWAQKLYELVLDFAHIDNLSSQKVLDLYAGTWTIWMIFAKAWAKSVTSVEMVKQASENWKANAILNWLNDMDFKCAKVEDFLKSYLDKWNSADLLIIDPPRAWMHPDALPNILKFWVNQIIYVSCNPSTLSRDLWYIMNNSDYKIEKIQAMDMFPHTHHIETIVSLIKS